VSLTDSLECQDPTLLESLSHHTHYFLVKKGFSMKFPHTIHMLSQNIVISCQTHEIQSQMPKSYMHNLIHHTQGIKQLVREENKQ